MKRILLVLFTLFLSIESFSQPANAPQSQVVCDSIYSKALNCYRKFNIYLPKSYNVNSDKKYPILYLLHGMSDTQDAWFLRGHVKDVADLLMRSGEACEMIIVSPNAGGSIQGDVWNGYFNMPGWQYETFFYKEFIPYIEQTYRVIANKGHRAIAGLSMGGGGCAMYAQHHSDMFSSCYAMSALVDIPDKDTSKDPPINTKIGILTKSVRDNSCIKYVLNATEAIKQELRSVNWFVDCGDDDFLLDRNIEFYQAMRNAHIPCEFRVRDGQHEWEYWHSALYTCLHFTSRNFYNK